MNQINRTHRDEAVHFRLLKDTEVSQIEQVFTIFFQYQNK